MKLLQNSKLESVSAALCVNTGDCILNGRSVHTLHQLFLLQLRNECDYYKTLTVATSFYVIL